MKLRVYPGLVHLGRGGETLRASSRWVCGAGVRPLETVASRFFEYLSRNKSSENVSIVCCDRRDDRSDQRSLLWVSVQFYHVCNLHRPSGGRVRDIVPDRLEQSWQVQRQCLARRLQDIQFRLRDRLPADTQGVRV